MFRLPFPTRSRLLRLPVGVVRAALVVRVVDEWWSYLPAGAIGDLRRDLGVSYAQSGWLIALLSIGGFVGSPLAALADRGHRRLLACSGAGLLTAGLLTYAAAPPFLALAIASTGMGMASDLLIRPLETSLAEVAGDDLDRQLGRQHLLTWLGDFISPALLAIGAATFIGWRGVFASTAVITAAYGLVLAAVQFPEPPAAGDDDPTLWRSALALARSWEVLLLSAAEFLLLPLDETFLGFAVARRIGDDRSAAAQLLAGGMVVGGIGAGLLIGRVGLTRRFTRGGALAMVGGALGAAVPAPFVVQVVAMAVMGFGTAVVWAKVHHRTLTLVAGRASTTATVVSMLSTPALVVPTAVGWLADRTSLTVGLIACASLAIPLVAIVLRLGGGDVAPEELEDD